MAIISAIKIGASKNSLQEIKMFSSWADKNKLEYLASVPMTNDGTIHTENVDAIYRPEVTNKLNVLLPAEYAQISKLLNVKSFVIQYPDRELMTTVIRYMQLVDARSDTPISFGMVYRANTNVEYKMKSLLAYESYSDLAAKATNDSRIP
jgi:hypothetical protein